MHVLVLLLAACVWATNWEDLLTFKCVPMLTSYGVRGCIGFNE